MTHEDTGVSIRATADVSGGESADARADFLPEPLSGEIVYMYAFDIAYEMKRSASLRTLLGEPIAQFAPGASKRNPRQLFFYLPQMVRLPSLERFGPRGPIRLERTVKLLPVGAISITVRVPFTGVGDLGELVTYHDLRFADGTWLYDEVRDLAERVRRELRPLCVRPAEQLGEEEAYTVFCIASTPPGAASREHASTHGPHAGDGRIVSTERWLGGNRRQVASLLTEEHDVRRLSSQEADESSGKHYSYYENDLVVIDWDAALVVDQPKYFDEVLHLIELANVQLAEVEAYDRILDESVERAYRDLSPRRRVRGLRTAAIQRELREIRIDMARLSDELSNITKFFGDWHLARIYKGLSDRFHLADWHRAIDEKLKTLDDLYQLLRADQMNRWMLILEATIVLLFVLDILMLFIWK